jgi:hypothetical protein
MNCQNHFAHPKASIIPNFAFVAAGDVEFSNELTVGFVNSN